MFIPSDGWDWASNPSDPGWCALVSNMAALGCPEWRVRQHIAHMRDNKKYAGARDAVQGELTMMAQDGECVRIHK